MASAQVVNWLAMKVRTLERRIQDFEFEKAKCDAIMEAGFGGDNYGKAEKCTDDVELNNAKLVTVDGGVKKHKDEVEPNNARFVTADCEAETFKENVELNATKFEAEYCEAEKYTEDVVLNTAKCGTTDCEAEKCKEDFDLITAKRESKDFEKEVEKKKRKKKIKTKKKPEGICEIDDAMEADADKSIDEVEQRERSTEEVLREWEMTEWEFSNMSSEDIGARLRKAAEHEFECEVSYTPMGVFKETCFDMLGEEFKSEEEAEKALLLYMKKNPGALRTLLMKKMRQKTEFCGVTGAKHDIDGESVS